MDYTFSEYNKQLKTSKSSSGVDYKKIDPVKISAQILAKKTSSNFKNFNFKEVAESRGESAFVWEEKDCYRAEVIEGLGTKSLVADKMFELTGKSYYRQIAKDTIATIINDVITVGARPVVVNAYFAAGKSDWFDSIHAKELVKGWHDAVQEIGAVWGGGESPALPGLINNDAIDLAGNVHGLIKPKKNLVLDANLKAGNQIVLIESNGIHANGLTIVRKLSENLKNGYLTKLTNGNTFGEEILRPSHLYSRLVENIQKKVRVKYMVNITGHGWRKLMRARNNTLSYVVEKKFEPDHLFKFIQKESGFTDEQMYGAFNMGAGFAFFVEKADVNSAIDIAQKLGFNAIHAGFVGKGPKRLEIRLLGITFPGSSLSIR